ncbi:hypothetical protein SOV_51810 [Sporomusa ovata DSM 2662]|uniref:hypothetical protein n=1 Tax=Sporomusa ovata TaxID=2378 RepID=UPI000388461C|nr:hypothetical protein [Sporomusa ovata]EQB27553.1 hypothetical protein SOV_2c04500 [Sporomusa ovata DSM 2662]
MKTLVRSLPPWQFWQFWFIYGFFGIALFVKVAIKFHKRAKPVPFIFKWAWLLGMLLFFLVIAESFNDGTGLLASYELFFKKIDMPIVLLFILSYVIFAIQQIMRTEFDPVERKIALIKLLILVGCVIMLTWLLGPFIWEHYYK